MQQYIDQLIRFDIQRSLDINDKHKPSRISRHNVACGLVNGIPEPDARGAGACR
jgi:hypothetical protein